MTEKDVKRFKSAQKAKDKVAKEAVKDPIVTQKKQSAVKVWRLKKCLVVKKLY